MNVAIVIPTIGRPSLLETIGSIARSAGPLPREIVVVDDRRSMPEPLSLSAPDSLRSCLRVVRSGGRGPAAARNVGWRTTVSPWVCFVDDDVVVSEEWLSALERDLREVEDDAGGVQGQIEVPLPSGPVTDWERNVAGLAQSSWITADMAYRRAALERTGGFDERFRRAYREDSDLALRIVREGFALRAGKRVALHPVRKADAWVSVRLQAGNADDVLMRALHGRHWRMLAQAPAGRFPLHFLTVGFAASALAAMLSGARWPAAFGAFAWAFATAQFAWSRIAPGPRTPREIVIMSATSALIPFAAVYHKARGIAQLPRLLRGDAA